MNVLWCCVRVAWVTWRRADRDSRLSATVSAPTEHDPLYAHQSVQLTKSTPASLSCCSACVSIGVNFSPSTVMSSEGASLPFLTVGDSRPLPRSLSLSDDSIASFAIFSLIGLVQESRLILSDHFPSATCTDWLVRECFGNDGILIRSVACERADQCGGTLLLACSSWLRQGRQRFLTTRAI